MVQGNTVSEINPNFAVEPKIPVGVYDISITRRGIFLEKISDEFVFPYKIYGLQTDFINHIIKTYNNTTGNIGVLMNGIKGTGKTVSAKILANQLQLPVIILKNMGDETGIAIDYVSTLACDCIIFMDEFEKNFSTENQDILQLMDGVYNSEHRKVFLLTTNELNVNDNLLGRPSRIRYVKQFGNLDKATVEEYIDENLMDISAKQDIIDFIDTLTISTIDILKSIVNEVNIHGIDGFINYREFFNVTTEKYSYSTYYGCVNQNNIDQDTEGKYTIEKFLTEVDHYQHPMPRVYFKDPENPTEEEKAKYDAWCKYSHYDIGCSWESVSCDRKFTSLREGVEFDGSPIVKIDVESRVIITYSAYNERYYFYFIINPEAKPSLYNNYNKNKF